MKRQYDSTSLERHFLSQPFFFVFFISLFFFPRPGRAVRPISSSVALVAGQGEAGFRDGTFTTALFNKPLGLAASSDGTRLFVADSGNNRIRMIQLDQKNQVTTLAGQDKPGKQDGPLASARFNRPSGVLYLPDERLVVNDSGNKLLRLIDLKTGTVSTLGGSNPTTMVEGSASSVSMAGIRDMAYLPGCDSLFFTQPEQMTLKRLDMKTGLVSLVPNNLPEGLGHPFALGIAGNKLYVSDRDDAKVFALEWNPGTVSAPVPSLAVTAGSAVLSLAQSGDNLYALQMGVEAPLQRLLPANQPVTFTTIWGDDIPQPGLWFLSLGNLNMQDLPGIAADPLEPKHLYIANPCYNIVTSLHDLASNQDSPAPKPPQTFRILIVGDSRSLMIVGHHFQTSYNVKDYGNYPSQVRFSKRLEAELNALAAIEDAPLNFEVINMGTSATEPLFLWPTYGVPNVVQKDGIDLVLIIQPPTPEGVFPFKFYFMNPITPEGIPQYPNDMEYLLKPPLQRIPDGVARKFYDFCKEYHLVKIQGQNFVFDQSLYARPELHDLLVEMYGKPLDLLSRKLSVIKTSSGQPVRLLLCSTHTGIFRPNAEDPAIWVDVARKFHVPFLDLNDEMTALGLSFYPLAEIGGNDHLNPEGHLFFSLILAHALIHDGFLPWTGTPLPSNNPGTASKTPAPVR